MFLKNISLLKHSNYKIGGPAENFYEAKNIKDLKSSLLIAEKNNHKIFILAGGTNILFDDSGFSGAVIKPKFSYVKKIGKNKIRVGAGTVVSDVLKFTIKEGLSGFEWAGGLPGTIGGAIRGNAGCFGGEVKDIVSSVKAFKFKGKQRIIRSFNRRSCGFGYRDSIFKRSNDYIILEATFLLKQGNKKEIRKMIQEKIDYRNKRHPMEYPSIGSMFKNIPAASLSKVQVSKLSHIIKTDPFPVVPAAYLISESGLKGVSCGGAMISPKHPNFIVNVQSASASDVKNLIKLTKNSVKKKFKIEMEEEVIVM